MSEDSGDITDRHDVLNRVAANRHKVSELSDFQAPYAVIDTERAGRTNGDGFERGMRIESEPGNGNS
jgi:hypothetical protein